MSAPEPRPLPECPTCHAHVPRKPWWRSRKFWCVMLGMSVPPVAWATVQLPIWHTVAMLFPPMAWGFGEWTLDLVKEVTRMLLAWVRAKSASAPLLPTPPPEGIADAVSAAA